MPSKLHRADPLGKMTGWLTKRVETGADTLTAFLNEVFSQLPPGCQERGLFGANLCAKGRRAGIGRNVISVCSRQTSSQFLLPAACLNGLIKRVASPLGQD